MGEHERPSGPPWPRFWIPLNALWAAIHAAVVLYWFGTHLPAEAWGIGFLLLSILPLWGVVGLVLWMQGCLRAGSRSRRAQLVPLSAFLVGAVLLVGALSIPARLFLPLNVGPVLDHVQPEEGRDVVPIPSDQHPFGHGRFVREDFERSAPDRALLPLGTEAAPWQSSLEVVRGTVSITEDRPDGANRVLAYPIRDGWRYVMTEN